MLVSPRMTKPEQAVRLVIKLIAGVALAMGLLALIVPTLQRRLMYYPDTQHFLPADAALDGLVEERVLQTPDGDRVLAWYGKAKPGRPTILYFHGNAGSLETRSERIRKYMARGLGIFMMTYRGFGGSTGEPSEKSNVADAKLAYDTLTASVDPKDIIIYGESLGTGVAVQVAAVKKAAGLVLDAPYTSMVELAALHYPYIPGRWFMTDRYETRTHIRDIALPLLILHGERDTIVPVAMGREIYALAPEPKAIRTFPLAGHADHYKFGSYDALYAWIEDLRRGSLARRAG